MFIDQSELAAAFKAGELERDFIAVVRFQGPKANGMPELHKLTPFLGVLQDRGYKVALVTDGRMSGASGKVPAAIHVCPEALDGGPLALVRDGDIIRVDGETGELLALVDPAEWATRQPAIRPEDMGIGCGRELFAFMRASFSTAEQGASAFTEVWRRSSEDSAGWRHRWYQCTLRAVARSADRADSRAAHGRPCASGAGNPRLP